MAQKTFSFNFSKITMEPLNNNLELRIIQWNCRTIHGKLQIIKHIINEHRPHIFALNETRMDEHYQINLRGFYCIRKDRSRRGGGVAIFIREDLEFREKKSNISSEFIENAVCQINWQGKQVSIFNCYIPPNANISETDLRSIFDITDESYIILGDLNAHNEIWGCFENNQRGRWLLDAIESNDAVLMNTGAVTRVSCPPQRDSAVDMAICSRDVGLSQTWTPIENTFDSDHLPILIEITVAGARPKKLTKRMDVYKHIDKEKFCNEIREEFVDFQHAVTPEETYKNFMAIITTKTKECKVRKTKSNFIKPIWWNENCDEAMENISQAYKNLRDSGTRVAFLNLRKAEAVGKQILKRTNNQSFQKFAESLRPREPIGKVWSMAKKFDGNTTATKALDINVAEALLDKCATPFVIQRDPQFIIPSNIQFQKFTMCEFEAILEDQKDTAVGLDGISYGLIKKLPSSIKAILLQIFNECIEKGSIPDEWRESCVIHIRKPNKPSNELDSFRPITLLAVTRKCIEKMIGTRIEYHMETNNKLPDQQYGFRKGRGTRDCVTLLYADILHGFLNKQQTLAVFIDVKSAYDNVLIDFLCTELIKTNLDPFLCRFIWVLFNARVIYLDGKHNLGSRKSNKGIPQGSPISPMLFNILTRIINQLDLFGCKYIQYADDIVIYATGPNIDVLQRNIQDAVIEVQNCLQNIGLNLAPTKTQMILFTRKYKIGQISINVGNHIIHLSDSVKYLGVIFDKRCSWRPHIDYTCRKARKGLNFMRAISSRNWGASPFVLTLLYKALVRSHLEYCCMCFAAAAKTYIIQLQRVQWASLRIILGTMKSSPTAAMEVMCGMVPLELRFQLLGSNFLTTTVMAYNHPLNEVIQKIINLGYKEGIFEVYATLPHRNLSTNRNFPCYYVNFDVFIHGAITDCDMQQKLKGIPKNWSSAIAQQEFEKLIFEKYINTELIFTDGSKTEGKCGCAFYHEPECETSLRLPADTTIFTAEAFAITTALSHLSVKHQQGNFVICTDSLSVIKTLEQKKINTHTEKIIIDIKTTLTNLQNCGYRISFLWIPSHVGIQGNEKADELAKQALEAETIHDYRDRGSSATATRKAVIEKWQVKWDTIEEGRFYYSIQSTVQPRAWYHGMIQKREFLVFVNRLLLNHHRLNSHLMRIGIGEGMCHCGENFATPDHIVWQCGQLRQRETLLEELYVKKVPRDIRTLLVSRNMRALKIIFNFLKLNKVEL
jgi:ribonuclease HI